MSKLLESLCVMAELTGTEWSKPTIQVIEKELSAYPEQDVLMAIRRCQTELRARVSLADILDRLPNDRPGVEEAWSLVSKVLGNDYASICWTDEMRQAYGAAAPLVDDPVSARMAFKEKYGSLVREARATRKPVSWAVSPGWDKALREECAIEAARKNLISKQYATQFLSCEAPTSEAIALLQEVEYGKREAISLRAE